MKISSRLSLFLLACCAVTVTTTGVQASAAERATTPPFRLPAGVQFITSGRAMEGTPEVFKFKLANGLKVLILPDQRNPLATLRIKLDAGSNREKLGTTGLAHFFEHMMFRKTQVTPAGHYDQVLSGVGGRGNAATSTDYVVYESTFPGPAFEKMLELESQRFKLLDLQDPYFTVEKGAVISERRMRYENDPLQRGQEILRRAYYKGTPYEWFTIGTKQDVEQMSIEDARRFYSDFYAPDNAQLFVGGPFKIQDALQKVDEAFGDWSGKVRAQPPRRPERPDRDLSGREFVCSESVFEEHHSLIFPSSDTSYRSAVLTQILMQMLNDNPDGTLQRRMTKKKLATNVAVYKTSWQKLSQPYAVFFKISRQQNYQAARDYFLKELEEVLKRPLTSEIKKILLKQQEVEDAEVAQKMTALVEYYEWNEYFYGDFKVSAQTRKIIESLTTKEFHNWVREAFSLRKAFHIGVTAPDKAMPCAEFEKVAAQK